MIQTSKIPILSYETPARFNRPQISIAEKMRRTLLFSAGSILFSLGVSATGRSIIDLRNLIHVNDAQANVRQILRTSAKLDLGLFVVVGSEMVFVQFLHLLRKDTQNQESSEISQ
jgi:hypothetical protein